MKGIVNGSIALNNNNIIIAPENLKNVKYSMTGENNTLIIHEDKLVYDLLIQFSGSNATIIIGENTRIRGRIRAGDGCNILIGNNSTCTTKIQLFTAEHTNIIIGEDVMMAHNTMIRTEDSHAIYNVSDGSRVNTSKDVYIGAHVWLGENVTILSGSHIGSGTIIGLGSIVTNQIPNNCVAVGSPAKVIKTNVAWERPNLALSKIKLFNNALE